MKYRLLKEAALREMMEEEEGVSHASQSRRNRLLKEWGRVDSMYAVSFYGDSMDPHPIVIKVEADDEQTALEMAVAKLEKEYDGACLGNPYDENNGHDDMSDDYEMEVDATMYGASHPWYVNPQLIRIKEIGPVGG